MADAIPLPDPPLHDDRSGLLLRPWGGYPGDATALAAAWTDPTTAAETRPPEDRSPEAAARWIAGEAERRRRGLALDLVISWHGDHSAVLGEVGLANLDDSGRAEIGFWLAPLARGQGFATVAIGLLTVWALAPDGLGCQLIWARVRLGNRAAGSVLRRAGYAHQGDTPKVSVWVRLQ